VHAAVLDWCRAASIRSPGTPGVPLSNKSVDGIRRVPSLCVCYCCRFDVSTGTLFLLARLGHVAASEGAGDDR
jgi:hypothetical protein